LISVADLPERWGLLEWHNRKVTITRASGRDLRSGIGLRYEMNLLLASLRRVEIRIEPESITDFLKWKNRMAEYNRGAMPEGIVAPSEEANVFLEGETSLGG